MANEEEKQLDSILVEKEAPSRVDDKENKPKKVAKLTGRTISSLKTKIKEKRMGKAYKKYNKKYQQMKESLINAEAKRKEQQEGENITDSELAVEYSIVMSYDKKLAKKGAKLLKNEIKQIVADMDLKDKVSVGKPIRVPRFILTKMRKLVSAQEKIREKKLRKKMVKGITKTTKEYIENSFDSALFNEKGKLQDSINATVIKDLSLKGGKQGTERRLDTLRNFISQDGKSPLFSADDSELENKNKTKIGTNLPPIEPTPTTEKGENKINVDDLIKAFEKKQPEIAENIVRTESKKEENKAVLEDGKNKNNERKKEIAAIKAHSDAIKEMEDALKGMKDQSSREFVKSQIAVEREALENLSKIESVNKENKKDESSKDSIEPIEIKPKEDASEIKEETVVKTKKIEKPSSMENVAMKDSESIRVIQISNPSALRVTLQDIKKLEERNKLAQSKIVELKREKEELENQKEILKQFIEQAQVTRDSELKAQNMASENATLKNEVAELSSEAAAIGADLGRSK